MRVFSRRFSRLTFLSQIDGFRPRNPSTGHHGGVREMEEEPTGREVVDAPRGRRVQPADGCALKEPPGRGTRRDAAVASDACGWMGVVVAVFLLQRGGGKGVAAVTASWSTPSTDAAPVRWVYEWPAAARSSSSMDARSCTNTTRTLMDMEECSPLIFSSDTCS
jgi:hypothetical protein